MVLSLITNYGNFLSIKPLFYQAHDVLILHTHAIIMVLPVSAQQHGILKVKEEVKLSL
jgi:hypothetical protein